MADDSKFDPLARTRLDSGYKSSAAKPARIKEILTSLGEMPPDKKSEAKADIQEKTLLLGQDQSMDTLIGWLVEIDPQTGPVKSHELRRRSYVLGRGDSASIRIQGKTVSREHCTISWKENGFEITDNDSGNGVFVDGYPRIRSDIADGTIIRLGDVEIWVKLI